MKKICFLFFIFYSYGIFASLSARLDMDEATVKDRVHLTVTISGRLESEVNLPKLENIAIIGRSQSSNVSIINGTVKRQLSYTYTLVPNKEGVYNIPPITAMVSGKKEQSESLVLKVGKASQEFYGKEEGKDGKEKSLPFGFVKRTLSKHSAFVGEPIISTVEFYFRVGISNVGREIPGKPGDFRYLEWEYEKKRKRHEGTLYDVYVFKRALIPLKSSNIILGPYIIQAQFSVPGKNKRRGPDDDFIRYFFNGPAYNVVTKTLLSEKEQIEIKKIPRENRPQDYKGLVGGFVINSELSDRQLKAGETTTLTITMEGYGPLDSVLQPKLNFPSSVKVYADKPKLEERKHPVKGLVSKKVFKFALVPTVEGNISLGKYKESVFNPEQEEFVAIETDFGEITVEKGDVNPQVSGSSPISNKSQKKVEASAASYLIDIKRDLNKSSFNQGLNLNQFLVYLLGVLALVYLVLLAKEKKYFFSSEITDKQRSKMAYNSYEKKKKKIELAGQKSSIEDFYQIFKEFLVDKFSLKNSNITIAELKKSLRENNLQDEIRNDILELIKLIDKMSYGATSASAETHKKNKDIIDTLVKKVESDV